MKLNFPVDAELNDHFVKLTTYNLTIAKIHDPVKAGHAIFNAIFETLLKNEQLVVTIGNNQIWDQVSPLLQSFDLEKYCFQYKSDQFDEHQKSNLLKANIPLKSLKLEDLNALEKYLTAENQHLSESYKSLSEPKFGETSLLQLIETYQKAKAFTLGKEEFLNIDISLFEFNKDSFWELRNSLKSTIDKYNPIFSALDKSKAIGVRFIDKYNLTTEHGTELLDQLNGHIKSVESLIQTITKFYNSHVNQLLSQSLKVKNHCLAELKDIREHLVFIKYFNQEKSKGLFNLKKTQVVDLSPIQKKLTHCLDYLNQDSFFKEQSITKGDINEQSHNIDLLIEQLNKLVPSKKYFSKYAQRMNIHHFEGEQKNNLLKLIDSVITEINDSQILDETIEPSGFTILHQLESLTKVQAHLLSIKEINSQVENYLIWKSHFIKQSPQLISIVNELKKYPLKNWMYIFEAWYIKQLVQKDENLLINDEVKLFEYASSLNKKLIEEKLAFIHNQIARSKEVAKTHLKQKNKAIFKSIYSSKLFNCDINSMLKEAPEFIQNFYPILVIDQKQSNLLNENPNLNFNQQIIIEPQSFSNDKLDELIKRAAKNHFIASSNHEVTYSENLIKLNPKKIELKISYPNPININKLTSTSESYKHIKRLARNIFEINNQYTVYQTKELSIISFWSSFKNNLLEAHLESNQIKEINSDDPQNGIIEALMETNKKVIVLFEEGMLNKKSIELYTWQFYLIQCLQNAGVYCFNVWSSDLYFNDTDSIKEIINFLKSSTSLPVEMKKSAVKNLEA